jgi:hypothetical protein
MNAIDRKIVNARRSVTGARFLGCAAGASLLAACAGVPIASTRIDPSSPVAGEVAKLSRSDRDYPKFSEIPPKPSDLRPVRVYGREAQKLEAARDELDRATAPQTWTLQNTSAFAARAQAEAGPSLPPGSHDTEAFANSVRKRATPPPSPAR